MLKRAGVTEKISVSLHRDELAALRKRAKRLHGGNLSAVIAELAVDAKLLEGMNDLVSWLGGPSLSDDDRERIDRELRGDALVRGAVSPAEGRARAKKKRTRAGRG